MDAKFVSNSTNNRNKSSQIISNNSINDNYCETDEDIDEGVQGCDHEPGLEFDDSDLINHKQSDEVDDETDTHSESSRDAAVAPMLIMDINKAGGIQYIESPIDDLLEENFEEAFRDSLHIDEDDDDDEDENNCNNIGENNVNAVMVNNLKLNSSNEKSKLDSNLNSNSVIINNECKINNDNDFTDIAKYGIVDVSCDDAYGRKVITIYAYRLPSNRLIDHNRLLKYLMFTLDQYVENDYSLVYFHYGFNSSNKPSFNWLWQAYKAFDRKYKKNLKALYLVHPTNFIRVFWKLFSPIISVKFGRKVRYVNCIIELEPHLDLQQLIIPQPIIDHDKKLQGSLKRSSWFGSSSSLNKSAATSNRKFDTQQFGVSLQFIKDHNGNGEMIPNVVKVCISYLDNEIALQTEGIFRRCANTTLVKEIKEKFNCGNAVEFGSYQDEQNIHLAAVTLKSFFRELEQPLLTYDVYDDVMDFQSICGTRYDIEKVAVAKSLILQKLPPDNYTVLKYLVTYLVKVMDRSDLNKMTASNLAIVFGPNLLWSKQKQASLDTLTHINHFTEILLKHHDLIFIK